jgi:hypothetical protein
MKPSKYVIACGGVLVVFAALALWGLSASIGRLNAASNATNLAQNEAVPEVVVLSTFFSGEIRGQSFYVKSTDKLCHLTTTNVLISGALDCKQPSMTDYRKIAAVVGIKL